MLSEISQRMTNTVYSHINTKYMKAELIETESKIVVARCWGRGGNGEMLVKEYTFQAIRRLVLGI